MFFQTFRIQYWTVFDKLGVITAVDRLALLCLAPHNIIVIMLTLPDCHQKGCH